MGVTISAQLELLWAWHPTNALLPDPWHAIQLMCCTKDYDGWDMFVCSYVGFIVLVSSSFFFFSFKVLCSGPKWPESDSLISPWYVWYFFLPYGLSHMVFLEMFNEVIVIVPIFVCFFGL